MTREQTALRLGQLNFARLSAISDRDTTRQARIEDAMRQLAKAHPYLKSYTAKMLSR